MNLTPVLNTITATLAAIAAAAFTVDHEYVLAVLWCALAVMFIARALKDR